jgi:hypothetical protein
VTLTLNPPKRDVDSPIGKRPFPLGFLPPQLLPAHTRHRAGLRFARFPKDHPGGTPATQVSGVWHRHPADGFGS